MLPKPEVINQHVQRYFPSLNANKEKYLSIFFQSHETVPDHFAYICPICVNTGVAFLEEYYLDTNADLTLDHFPPESVGGKQTLLVCKKCNNEAGGGFEGALKQKIEDISFNNLIGSSKRKMKTKISAVKGNYPGILSVRNDGTFGIDFKASEKVHAPLLDQWVENSKGDYSWTAEVTYFVADEDKVSKSLLKAAYLYCFQYWGYGFSYSNTADNIRKILSGDMEYPLKNPSFWLGKIAKSIERLQLGLCYVTAGDEFKCFCVNVQIIDKQTKHIEVACILIPGPTKSDWDELVRIQTILDKEPTMQVSFAHVMGNRAGDLIYDGYERSWTYLFSNN
ncbi:HNH endonuclease [Pedobacter aquatilis]|uniref:HNH endonuclease n=1 Tax=Pedobacter aquatilis TaxID=351343 RepID=UPI00293091ED|nr:HNH endonuclease [Pedobacter aquatilis]